MATVESTHLRTKRWTRDECAAVMEKAGIDLTHYELIEGELVEKMPKGFLHNLVVTLLTELLQRIFGMGGRVLSEKPLHLNDASEPEPDVMVLNRPLSEIGHNPNPDDVLFVVEVADTNLAADLAVKTNSYAGGGITDYWILDIPNRRFLVYRDSKIFEYEEHEPVTPLAAAHVSIRAKDVLP